MAQLTKRRITNRATKLVVDALVDESNARDVIPPFGAFIEDIEFTSGQVIRLAHGLGRDIQGYVIIRNSAGSVFSDDFLTNVKRDRFLELTEGSAQACTITIWVF